MKLSVPGGFIFASFTIGTHLCTCTLIHLVGIVTEMFIERAGRTIKIKLIELC